MEKDNRIVVKTFRYTEKDLKELKKYCKEIDVSESFFIRRAISKAIKEGYLKDN